MKEEIKIYLVEGGNKVVELPQEDMLHPEIVDFINTIVPEEEWTSYEFI